jgi:hypothetical protein
MYFHKPFLDSLFLGFEVNYFYFTFFTYIAPYLFICLEEDLREHCCWRIVHFPWGIEQFHTFETT